MENQIKKTKLLVAIKDILNNQIVQVLGFSEISENDIFPKGILYPNYSQEEKAEIIAKFDEIVFGPYIPRLESFQEHNEGKYDLTYTIAR